MHHVPLAFQCIYGYSDERGENGDGKEGSDIPGGWERMEIDLRVMAGQLAEVRRRGLKVNADNSKVMVLNGEEGLE